MNNILWLPYSLSAILAFFGFISKPLKPSRNRRPVDIIITTIGKDHVASAVINTINKCIALDTGKVIVLTEPHVCQSIKDHCTHNNIEMLIVPPSWHEGTAKGRAIWWFSRRYADPNKWYMMLDDDSYPLDDTFCYEIDECERKHRYVGNCRLISRGGGTIPKLCDNLRYTDDRTIFRFTLQGLKRPLIGLHGEGLIVKGNILRRYFNNIYSIVEDAEFGCLINGRVKTFQSATDVSILSPLTVRDFWKQRRRWFVGLWSIYPKFSTLGQIIIGLRMLAWSLGWLCLSIWTMLFLWWDFDFHNIGEFYYIRVFSVIGFFLLLLYYGIGSLKTKTFRKQMLYFFPCVFVESIIPIYSFWTGNRKGFEVINKNEGRLEDGELSMDHIVS